MQSTKIEQEKIIRDEIIRAAHSLFQKYGLNKTTMEDIAKASSKGKSTLYYYYKSKDEIFEMVVLKEMDELISEVKKSVNKVATAEAKLFEYIKANFRVIKEKLLLYKIVNGEIKANLNLLLRTLRDKFDTYETSLIKDIFMFGLKNGEFKNITKDNINMVSKIFVSALGGIQINIFFENRLSEYEYNSIDLMCNLLLNGIK